MNKFKYTAMDARGRESRGCIEADDQQDATNKLKRNGLFPTSVSQVKGFSKSKNEDGEDIRDGESTKEKMPIQTVITLTALVAFFAGLGIGVVLVISLNQAR
jgi:type II secretory pathway component PulF